MNGDPRSQALDGARESERAGEVDQAVRGYLRAGAVAEAARVLVAARRHGDAGQILMDSLGIGPAHLGNLDADGKARAAKAAACFAQAGQWKRAQEIFVGLGDFARAGEAAERVAVTRLEQTGQHEAAIGEYVRLKAFADAGRVAYRLKRFGDAAPHFEAAGMSFEAAACYAEAGDRGRCLEAVVRVPPEHPKYRLAAAQAMRMAAELGVIDSTIDRFLGPMIANGPRDDREVESFYLAAGLYQSRSRDDDARDLYERIATARPGYRDVAEQIATLATETREAQKPDEPVARAEGAFEDKFMAALKNVEAAAKSARAQAPPRPKAPAESKPFPAATVAAPSSVPEGTPGELVVGSIVAERYRIEAKIGQGGMAAVYRATDLELGEQIAMKLYVPQNEDPQVLARFKQELLLSRGLAHPNIVRLYDIGQHQGCRFLTMELLQGTNLSDAIGGRPLERARGLRYMMQAAAGLGLAHAKGIIHRDIKPANFFITSDDTLKVMDFGIAKKTAQGAGMTQAGFIAGTPSYMSPEQISDFATVTHLTDMYALGVVAYEVFTGTLPFENEQTIGLLMMHMTEPPPSPRARNPDLPPELERLILKLLEKDPTRRIQSCRELREMLVSVAELG